MRFYVVDALASIVLLVALILYVMLIPPLNLSSTARNIYHLYTLEKSLILKIYESGYLETLVENMNCPNITLKASNRTFILSFSRDNTEEISHFIIFPLKNGSWIVISVKVKE